MPIYTFECKLHGKFEQIHPVRELENLKKNGVDCPFTKEVTGFAHLIGDGFGDGRAYLVPSLPANVQIGKPTIVFRNPTTGIAQVATSEYDPTPKGFIREEIKGSIERTKFENEQNKLHAREDDIYNENRRQEREQFRQKTIDDTLANLSSDAAKTDNPSETERLTKAAIEHIRKKPILKKKRRTEFVLDVNHKDKSNLV